MITINMSAAKIIIFLPDCLVELDVLLFTSAILDFSAAIDASTDSFSAFSFSIFSCSSYVVIFSSISLPESLPTIVRYKPKSAQLYS